MNFGALAPQLTQLLGAMNKGAGQMGMPGAAPAAAPGAMPAAPGGAPMAAPAAAPATQGPFTMPKGGLASILGGAAMPQGLLGMIMQGMQKQPTPLTPPGGAAGAAPAPTPFGSLMPATPPSTLGPIY